MTVTRAYNSTGVTMRGPTRSDHGWVLPIGAQAVIEQREGIGAFTNVTHDDVILRRYDSGHVFSSWRCFPHFATLAQGGLADNQGWDRTSRAPWHMRFDAVNAHAVDPISGLCVWDGDDVKARVIIRHPWRDRDTADSVDIDITRTLHDDDFYVLDGYAEGSLAHHMDQQLRSHLVGRVPEIRDMVRFEHRFIDGDAVTSARHNRGVWTRSIDLSAIPISHTVGGDADNEGPAGFLCTRRHLVALGHAPTLYQVGAKVYFLTQDEQIVQRQVVDRILPGDTELTFQELDASVVLLDSDVPESVKPMAIMPADYLNYLPCMSGRRHPISGAGGAITGVPCIRPQRFRVASVVMAISGADTDANHPGQAMVIESGHPGDLAGWYVPNIPGDSGTPSIGLIQGEPVVMGISSGDYGEVDGWAANTDLSQIINTLNEWIDELASGYSLTLADLSSFTDFSS